MDTIKKYFPDLTDTQLQQFALLEALYADWNAKINVISRKDIDNFYEHHVLHSLAIAKAVSFVPRTRILDVGTGGGFPGVPLAILFPESSFLLVDSIGKKLRVIDDIAEKVGLTNVQTLHDRAENVPGEFDFATSRAVTRLNEAWRWVSPKISAESKNSIANGLLYLKGGDISTELPVGVPMQRFELSEWFNEEYFSEKALIHLYN
jgi:16S rRNA (guanine527-N7)-methyltransferase